MSGPWENYQQPAPQAGNPFADLIPQPVNPFADLIPAPPPGFQIVPPAQPGPWTQYGAQPAPAANGQYWANDPLAPNAGNAGAAAAVGAAAAAGNDAPDLTRLEQAFMNAHKAGDTQAAQVLANEIRAQRAKAQGGNAQPASDGDGIMGDVNAVVNRLGTQFTKGITGLVGLPSLAADGLQAVGDWSTRQIIGDDNFARVQEKRTAREAQGKPTLSSLYRDALPSAQGMNNAIFNGLGVPEVNGQTPAGKILDVGLQAIPGGLAAGQRAVLPALTGGVTSETAGQVADAAGATPFWATLARVGGGVAGGLAGAAAQDVARTGWQAGKNALGVGNADDTAARISGRALARDKISPEQLARALDDLGPNGTIADAAGPNVRSTVRASVGTPGPARETAETFLTGRRAGEGERVAEAINSGVSGRQGFASTIDDIVAERSQRAAPLYEAAGVPSDPRQYAQAPLLASQEIKSLVSSSRDIQNAITQAKGLPQYAGLKDNSIVLLDKAYKNLGGKAEAARRSGDMALYRDLAEQRNMLKAAIVAERPEYGAALQAFSDDSALKSAIEAGNKLFKGATDPHIIAKEYGRLAPEAKELFKQGVAEQLRSTAERTVTGSPAAKVLGGPAMQEKLRVVLGADYDGFAAALNREGTFNRTMRDISVGSRTTPMAEDIADLGRQTSMMQDLFSGDFLRAAQRAGGNVIDRVTTGRRESVNNRIAQMLLDPNAQSQARTLDAIQRQLRAQELANQLRRNSYLGGATVPAAIGASQPNE